MPAPTSSNKHPTQSVPTYYSIYQSLLQKSKEGIESNGPLAMAKTGLVIGTQPLQVTMRMQQRSVGGTANPLSFLGGIKTLAKEGSVSAFFRGSGGAAAKEGFKYGVYKTPLLKGAPGIVDTLLPDCVHQLPSGLQLIVKSTAAGTFAATADTALGGSFEAYATYRATSQGKHKGASFAEELRALHGPVAKMQRIYKGAVPATAKGALAFSTFFAADKPANDFACNLYDWDPDKKKPWYVTATAAGLAGTAVAIASSPMDIIKTMAQMPDPNKLGLFETLKNNVKRHGSRGLTAGVGTKAIMVVLGWSTNYFFIKNLPEKKTLQLEHTEKTINPNP